MAQATEQGRRPESTKESAGVGGTLASEPQPCPVRSWSVVHREREETIDGPIKLHEAALGLPPLFFPQRGR